MTALVAAIVQALIAEEIALLPAEMDLLARGFAALVAWVESSGSAAAVPLAVEASLIVNGIVAGHAFVNADTERDDAIAAVTAYAAEHGIPATPALIASLVGPLLVVAHAPSPTPEP